MRQITAPAHPNIQTSAQSSDPLGSPQCETIKNPLKAHAKAGKGGEPITLMGARGLFAPKVGEPKKTGEHKKD